MNFVNLYLICFYCLFSVAKILTVNKTALPLFLYNVINAKDMISNLSNKEEGSCSEARMREKGTQIIDQSSSDFSNYWVALKSNLDKTIDSFEPPWDPRDIKDEEMKMSGTDLFR